MEPTPAPTPNSPKEITREQQATAREQIITFLEERDIPAAVGLGWTAEGQRAVVVRLQPDTHDISPDQIAEVRAMREIAGVPLDVAVITDVKPQL